MSTLNQSPINNIDQPSSLDISRYNKEFVSLAEKVTSKLQSLEDSPNPTSSEANAQLLAQDSIKTCYQLLVRVDDMLKVQLGSLNGAPEQIDITHTSQESIGPLSIDGIEEIPSFSSGIQNRYRIKPLNRPIPIQQIKPINSRHTQTMQQKLLYIGNTTVNAIKEVVQSLGLPSTLADISLAIQSSEKVLNAFLNDGRFLHIVPAEVQATRRDVFKTVCYSLVCGGNTTTLNSWEEVEEKLAEVFLFTPTIHPLPMNRQAIARPLRLRNRSHRQQRGSTTNVGLSLSSYKQLMKEKIGASKFEQIFNHAEALTTTRTYDELAKDIDDQIKQNEEIERQDQIREE